MNETLVRRLRRLEAEHKKEWGGATEESCLIAEAADAIEKLSAQLERKEKREPYQRTCMLDKKPDKKKKRKYYRKCGVCGERHEQSEMHRDEGSQNGWLCQDCHQKKHTAYYIGEF